MTVYTFIKETRKGGWLEVDTYDTVFDACITLCIDLNATSDDYYHKFCNELLKYVEIDEITDNCVTLKWYDMIANNIDLFRKFTENYWYNPERFDDDDDLIYEWINELDGFFAGNTCEDVYKTFCEEVIANMH